MWKCWGAVGPYRVYTVCKADGEEAVCSVLVDPEGYALDWDWGPHRLIHLAGDLLAGHSTHRTARITESTAGHEACMPVRVEADTTVQLPAGIAADLQAVAGLDRAVVLPGQPPQPSA